MKLQGERALVTGAGGGIGRATGAAPAPRSAVVAAADVDEVAVKETALRCGIGATSHAVDVRDRAALEAMRAELGELGVVVNLSSGLGCTPTAMESACCTTKAAVLQLSMSLRAGWSRRGVGVTAECPGIIATDIVRRTRYVGGREQDRATVEKGLRKGHEPEAVPEAVVRAIEGNRALALVGVEAKVGWALQRFAPIGVQQALARRGLG